MYIWYLSVSPVLVARLIKEGNTIPYRGVYEMDVLWGINTGGCATKMDASDAVCVPSLEACHRRLLRGLCIRRGRAQNAQPAAGCSLIATSVLIEREVGVASRSRRSSVVAAAAVKAARATSLSVAVLSSRLGAEDDARTAGKDACCSNALSSSETTDADADTDSFFPTFDDRLEPSTDAAVLRCSTPSQAETDELYEPDGWVKEQAYLLAGNSNDEVGKDRHDRSRKVPSSRVPNIDKPTSKKQGITDFHFEDATAQRQKKKIEKRWRKFFWDPSQWWDHRSEKDNPRYPDFRHKNTNESLWLNGVLNPPWVESALSSTPAELLQAPTFVWNKRLQRHVRNGQYENALDLFDQMQQGGIRSDKITFVALLTACSRLRKLREGKDVHRLIVECGCGSDLYLSSSLVDMYAKCGSIEEAQKVFDGLPERDVVLWNAMILGHVKCGQGQKALGLVREMRLQGVEPDSVTFVGMLNACTTIGELKEGRLVHEEAIRRGLDSGIFVGSSLIDMYATCGSVGDARIIFDKMPVRDVACWNAMIQGYVKCGHGKEVLGLFKQMQQEGMEPNSATLLGLLNACAMEGALEDGRRVHELAIRRGLESGTLVGSCLIHMYIECGQVKEAWRVFNTMPTRDVVTWNAMIEGCVKSNRPYNALEIYPVMHKERVKPDVTTFLAVLDACATMASLEEGKLVHSQVVQRGLQFRTSIAVSLINMYARCRSMEDALTVFNELPAPRGALCWNAMLRGHVNCGHASKALEFYRMMQLENVNPDAGTYVEVLNACASSGALEEGKSIHARICKSGYDRNVEVSSSLANLYFKCSGTYVHTS